MERLTQEEQAKLSPEDLTAYIDAIFNEINDKDAVNASLSDELANASKAGVVQKLKLGKQNLVMNYGAIRQDDVVYSYEDLKKMKEADLKKIVDKDAGSFTFLD